MLHDIGKLVLWVNFKKKYAAALLEAGDDAALLIVKREGDLCCSSRTRRLVGTTMAARLADGGCHFISPRSPRKIAGAFPLVKIVFLANMLSREDTGNGEKVLEVARALFDMDDTQVRDIWTVHGMKWPMWPGPWEFRQSAGNRNGPRRPNHQKHLKNPKHGQETDPSQKRLKPPFKTPVSHVRYPSKPAESRVP